MKTKEQRHLEDLDRLKSFRPIDDTFMRGLFKDNLPLTQFVLRIITDKPDLVLTRCDIQADLKLVTSEYRGNTAIGKLIHDFNCADADDMNYKILADKTRYLKENQKGMSEMCKAMEDLRTESFAEGKAEGITEGIAQGISQGIAQGIAQGLSQGLSQGKLDTIKIFLNNTHDAMLVASSLAEPLDYIEKIARDNNITLK